VERHQNYAESASHSTKKTRTRPQIDNVFVCNVFWIQVSKLEWCNGIHQRRQRKPQSPSGCYIQSRLGWRPESGDRDHGRTKPSAPAGGPRRVGSRGVRFSGRLVLGAPGSRGAWSRVARSLAVWSRTGAMGSRVTGTKARTAGSSGAKSPGGKITRAKSRGQNHAGWMQQRGSVPVRRGRGPLANSRRRSRARSLSALADRS
jgi:hypothetical protein